MTVTMSLREAIIHRVEDKNGDELREIIEDSIGNAEVTLPGLGVLFEIIWQNSPEEERNRMVDALHRQVHKDASS
ncbi:small, acid-soluble spore protein I [Cohnella xylanilytica]|nr:small acid-soluble spore protein SspI [Cohnella xylanilytica]GIO15629.1 small, acid-soluble spore protein I [Cohnella xylanilytica]